MPRLYAAAPKYRNHRASGQAVVTIQGKDHYLGPWKSKASKLEYDQLIGEWLAADRRFVAQPDEELTVTELVAAFYKFATKYYVKDGKSTQTAENMRTVLRLIKRIYGHTAASRFGPLSLKALQEKMIEEGHSRHYINMNAARIKRMFKWGVSQEMVPPSVYQALSAVPGLKKGRTPARETVPITPVSDSAVEATLAHLSNVPADMIRFQRLTGCRPGEVCIIRPCDVDTSDEVWSYRPESHKTEHHGRERVIFIGPQAKNILRPYLVCEESAYCFSPAENERNRRVKVHEARKTPLIYGNRPGTNRKRSPKRTAGTRYTVDSYRRAIHRACDKARIDRWSPNRLRHTAGTAIRKRYGLEAAQVTLGHASADVSQIYAERDLKLAATVMKEVG